MRCCVCNGNAPKHLCTPFFPNICVNAWRPQHTPKKKANTGARDKLSRPCVVRQFFFFTHKPVQRRAPRQPVPGGMRHQPLWGWGAPFSVRWPFEIRGGCLGCHTRVGYKSRINPEKNKAPMALPWVKRPDLGVAVLVARLSGGSPRGRRL